MQADHACTAKRTLCDMVSELAPCLVLALRLHKADDFSRGMTLDTLDRNGHDGYLARVQNIMNGPKAEYEDLANRVRVPHCIAFLRSHHISTISTSG